MAGPRGGLRLVLPVIDSVVPAVHEPNTAGQSRTAQQRSTARCNAGCRAAAVLGCADIAGREVLTVAGIFIREVSRDAKLAKQGLLTTGPWHCLSDAAMRYYRMMSPAWRNRTDQQLFLVDLCVLADFSYEYTRNWQHLRCKSGGCRRPSARTPRCCITVSSRVGRATPQRATSNCAGRAPQNA